MEVIIYFSGLLLFLGITFYISEWVYSKWSNKKDKDFDFDQMNDEHFGDLL